MIHDLVFFLREVFRRHGSPVSPDVQRSRELVTESNLRRDRGEQIIRHVEEGREAAMLSRIGILHELVQADEIAPFPRIGDEGRGR